MQSDNQLIRKIQGGQNRDAADTLIERYYKEIYAYAYRQTGNRETAMDLTQEIFIAILQGISSFDEKKASFRTWAYRVASNKIVNYYHSLAYQRQSREIAFLSGEEAEMYSGVCVEEFQQLEGQWMRDTEQLLIQRETIQQVMAVVADFDAEWIQIFQKKCFEEKTFSEIAEELALSSNTVKTRFYSMLKKIRQEVSLDG